MKRRCLYGAAVLLFFLPDAQAQWAVRVDPLNMAFQNYNVGLERWHKHHAFGADVSWLTKGWAWLNEFPGHADARGFRVNFDYKRRFLKKPAVYVGGMVRAETLYFPDITHWRAIYDYSRDDRRLLLGAKLGLKGIKNRFSADFGIGPGLRFLKRKEELLRMHGSYEDTAAELSEAGIRESLEKKAGKISVSMVPVIHLQLVWNFGNAFQANRE